MQYMQANIERLLMPEAGHGSYRYPNGIQHFLCCTLAQGSGLARTSQVTLPKLNFHLFVQATSLLEGGPVPWPS